jgi:hypothetical protein
VTFSERRNLVSGLRAIPLESVLRLYGARPDRQDKHKWHTSEGALSITGTKFMNWNTGIGGGGAIDLAMALNKFNFKDAVDWLARSFANSNLSESFRTISRRPLAVPPPDPSKLKRIKWYLSQQRGIPTEIVDSLVRSGTIYGDTRGNAVFLLRAEGNVVIGAEMRGTTDLAWRGMAPGSRKDLGFFSIPEWHRQHPAPLYQGIILCESAIDAISCAALHPCVCCISTAGARPSPPWLSRMVEMDIQIFCGFDADPTGDNMAQKMIALHSTVHRLRPAQHDWNDVLRSQSQIWKGVGNVDFGRLQPFRIGI